MVHSWPNTSLTVSILCCLQIFHSATCMQWCHFISCTLCVINLTMSLPQVLLQVPCLLIGLRGTWSLVVLPACSPFPPDIHPVASPPRAGSWLILLDERIVCSPFPPDVHPVASPPCAGSWLILLDEILVMRSIAALVLTVLLSLHACKRRATGLVFHH